MKAKANKQFPLFMFSGGGTGGSVTPLLAVAEELMKRSDHYRYLFIGTKNGPEKKLIASAKLPITIDFLTLPAGKWRRYFSLKNFFDIFKIIGAFFKSLIYLYRYRPRVIISAGSFVSVPLVWAAKIFKIAVFIHQQDIRPGLANRLMAPCARQIGVVFPESLAVYGQKAILLGNPWREQLVAESLASQAVWRQRLSLNDRQPLLLVLGGGTGSVAINQLMLATWPLIKDHWQVVHITGQGKELSTISHPNYHLFSLVSNLELLGLMATADLLITRAGLGTLTEISALAKPAIIIPLPNSHQEDNAAVFAREEAAWVFSQPTLSPAKLTSLLEEFRQQPALGQKLANRVATVIKSGGSRQLADILESWLN